MARPVCQSITTCALAEAHGTNGPAKRASAAPPWSASAATAPMARVPYCFRFRRSLVIVSAKARLIRIGSTYDRWREYGVKRGADHDSHLAGRRSCRSDRIFGGRFGLRPKYGTDDAAAAAAAGCRFPCATTGAFRSFLGG